MIKTGLLEMVSTLDIQLKFMFTLCLKLKHTQFILWLQIATMLTTWNSTKFLNLTKKSTSMMTSHLSHICHSLVIHSRVGVFQLLRSSQMAMFFLALQWHLTLEHITLKTQHFLVDLNFVHIKLKLTGQLVQHSTGNIATMFMLMHTSKQTNTQSHITFLQQTMLTEKHKLSLSLLLMTQFWATTKQCTLNQYCSTNALQVKLIHFLQLT